MPIRRRACPTGLALSILLLCASWATAQQVNLSDLPAPPRDRVPPPRTGTAGIKGRVVDGVTGGAVARARVTVQGPGRVSMVTDAAGGFAFANLPAGSVMLFVEKATYLSGRYPAAGKTIRSTSRPLTLANGQVLDNVTVPLFHGGAIMGRVLDANGDPLDNAQVNVMRVPGAGRSPGEYYVVAVDDLEPDDYRDPGVLDRLRSSATRVTIPDGSTVDVPLRRASFAGIMATR